MRVRAILFGVALAIIGAVLPAASQGQDIAPTLHSPILTVDRERLFSRSSYGQSILAEFDAESTALATENRRIETELMSEERALTDSRPTMAAAAFRQKAKEFDEKVVAIREAQDAKARNLVGRREQVQQKFYQDVLPILTEIVRERGAVMVLENRAVFLSADQIDITNEAITRIDTHFQPPSASDTSPD